METPKHPAKYSNEFIPIFADILVGKKKVLDPFAGVGKIGEIKKFGYNGIIFANDIEKDWLCQNEYGCDVISFFDAEKLGDIYPVGFFDAVCTSPTYGNRMADHHNAKDGSKRNTYTHCIGHELADGNTGKMQWGNEYREKHDRIYKSVCALIKDGGLFVLNISNHIRGGEEIDVVSWHIKEIQKNGFFVLNDIEVETSRNRFGANADKRVRCEHIITLKRG